MRYLCPKCGRHGMQWDARAKVLMCYYNTCHHVIRMNNRKTMPNPEETLAAIKKASEAIQNRTIETDFAKP